MNSDQDKRGVGRLMTDGGQPEAPVAKGEHLLCCMPECVGGEGDGIHAARDPEGQLLDICDSCLDDGWRSVVEVLE